MILAPAALETYRASMALARAQRHGCPDCEELRCEGAGPCARHAGHCVCCGAEDVAVAEEHAYADGVTGWLCIEDAALPVTWLQCGDCGGAAAIVEPKAAARVARDGCACGGDYQVTDEAAVAARRVA